MDDHHTDLPSGYRMEDQIVVYLAIQDLLQERDVAIDLLAHHLGDTRYSITFGSAEDDATHRSVGGVCTSIIAAYIWCYEDAGLLEVVTCDQHPVCAEGVGILGNGKAQRRYGRFRSR